MKDCLRLKERKTSLVLPMKFIVFLVSFLSLPVMAFQGANPYKDLLIPAVAGGEIIKPQDSVPARHAVAISIQKQGKGQSLCTGALVSMEMVVTAAHCFEKAEADSDIYIGFFEGSKQVKAIRAVRVAIHKNFVMGAEKFLSFADLDREGYDIALVGFTEEVPPGFEAARVLSDTSVLSSGVDVVAVGIGRTGNEEDPFAMRAIDLKIGFHDPDYVNASMLYDPLRTRAVCPGDSGGPVFVKLANQHFLWGVNQSVFKGECQPPYESFVANLAQVWRDLAKNLKLIYQYSETE